MQCTHSRRATQPEMPLVQRDGSSALRRVVSGDLGRNASFAALCLKGSSAERLCENYRELLQMPKIARFRRALVELNHQISNSRKRAARNHEESRVFTQPPDEADLGCRCLHVRFRGVPHDHKPARLRDLTLVN